MGTSSVLAIIERGSITECVHRGWIAVARADGTLVAHAGDPDRLVLPRSAMKPFQAVPVIESGAAERFAFGDAELAVCCASHNGEPRHREVVASMLERIGLTPSALKNGEIEPMDPESAARLRFGQLAPSTLFGDCSGKHTGMLAVCVRRGLSTDSYDDPSHPLQREIREIVASFFRIAPDAVIAGIDNCTLPAYGARLRDVATGWAAIADPNGAPDRYRRAIRRLGDAMAAEPFMVAGTGRLNTQLMQATGGRVLAKDGAEGVLCLALRDEGLGVALKIEDGSYRAHEPVSLAILRQLDAITPEEDADLSALWDERFYSHRRQHVATLRSVTRLAFV
jgi:L-asparaginase II